jgi:hypothetical protein
MRHRYWLGPLVFSMPAMLFGQIVASSVFNPLDRQNRGVRLSAVRLFGGYYSQGSSLGSDIPITTLPKGMNSDQVIGAVATFSWLRVGERTSVLASYSPSFVARPRNSDYKSVNHQFSFNWSRNVTPLWSISAGGAGVVSDIEQLLFTPTVYGNVAALNTTFDDLAAAVLAGNYTDPELASLLTGAPVVKAPEQSLLFGNRLMTATAYASLSWSQSPRSSVSVTGWVNRIQHLASSGDYTQRIGGSSYVVPRATISTVTLKWGYSLSPRTNISTSLTSNRIYSAQQTGYSVHLAAGRTLSRHWLAQASVGVGFVRSPSETFANSLVVQRLYSVSLGYKARAHTFLGSYDRTLGDNYGLGSDSTRGASAGWNWRPPGSRWVLFSSFQYRHLLNQRFAIPRSWRAGGGIARALSAHVSVSAEYTHVSQQDLARVSGNRQPGADGAILSLSWSPAVYR